MSEYVRRCVTERMRTDVTGITEDPKERMERLSSDKAAFLDRCRALEQRAVDIELPRRPSSRQAGR